MLRCNIHVEQHRRRFGCYVVAVISINFQHAMDATTFQHPFRATSRTLWMLRCNSHSNQLSGCYECYVVTSISSNLEDALDATFQQPVQSTSTTLWMLRCNMHFEQLRWSIGRVTEVMMSCQGSANPIASTSLLKGLACETSEGFVV